MNAAFKDEHRVALLPIRGFTMLTSASAVEGGIHTVLTLPKYCIRPLGGVELRMPRHRRPPTLDSIILPMIAEQQPS